MGISVVNGIRTHYQRMPARGAGTERPRTVVFVHGLGYDSLASFYLTLASPVSEAGIDVITYDLRAHGRTERPTTGYLMDDFTSDLLALLDELDVDGPVHLVGNSFGGTIAFSFAARYPELVRSIVAIEAEPATEIWADKMRRTLTNVVDGMEAKEYLAWLNQRFGAHHERLAKSAAAIIRATTIVQDVPSGPLLDAEALSTITCPVLSIVGSDGFQNRDLTALQASLPLCRTHVIEGQDHSVLVERHRMLRRIVLDWINEQEPVSTEAGAA
ncbi:alpha-beta hydrolase superfamily lysophospholipase [Herbihabitans rhizosphaerae]|uniref:Alpha-beta hydrolase superfamily lysophospholipase n=1 Tax=Herbihabitans rhizosphaerae TaxID=1872711 RepID=A0A4Q7KHS2_9PSEU|nr:alpha/beta fold hydrolase [Herbihabitans rhizosphaerae]RZS34104.1 alpha-beta hydrolase superfamily lysophospholipase [Herbihabitans rhizosphaerae]